MSYFEIPGNYRTNVLDNYKCGGYFFTSTFDSGNLGRVELLAQCKGNKIFHYSEKWRYRYRSK